MHARRLDNRRSRQRAFSLLGHGHGLDFERYYPQVSLPGCSYVWSVKFVSNPSRRVFLGLSPHLKLRNTKESTKLLAISENAAYLR